MTVEQDQLPLAFGVTDQLTELMRRQRELQLVIGGSDPRERSPEQQMEYIREMVLAATSELHEALDESGWKTWASSNHIHTEAMFSELCDALQFWMNLVSLLGKDGLDVARQLEKKRTINWARVNGNYTGLDKCSCGRAFDDPAVNCTPEHCVHTIGIVE